MPEIRRTIQDIVVGSGETLTQLTAHSRDNRFSDFFYLLVRYRKRGPYCVVKKTYGLRTASCF